MSYYKIKNISLKKKENKIMVCGASSNVFPITYYTSEFDKGETDFHSKELDLLQAINGGGFKLNESCYKWRYALLRTNLDLYNNGDSWKLYEETTSQYNIYTLGEINSWYGKRYIHIDKVEDNMIPLSDRKDNVDYYIKEEEEIDNQRIKNILEEYYKVFMKYLNEEDNNEYCLYSETYGYIKPKGVNGSFYYNISSNMIEPMDYKKAYCLAHNIKRDVVIKKLPKREYTPTQEQKQECEERIKILGLYEDSINKLYINKRGYLGQVSTKDIDLMEEINKFEKEHNAMVYYIIETLTSFGRLYAMLYVSNYSNEWEDDKTMLKDNQAYSYVWNSTNEYCSEIGLVGIEKHNGNIIERTF